MQERILRISKQISLNDIYNTLNEYDRSHAFGNEFDNDPWYYVFLPLLPDPAPIKK